MFTYYRLILKHTEGAAEFLASYMSRAGDGRHNGTDLNGVL